MRHNRSFVQQAIMIIHVAVSLVLWEQFLDPSDFSCNGVSINKYPLSKYVQKGNAKILKIGHSRSRRFSAIRNSEQCNVRTLILADVRLDWDIKFLRDASQIGH